MPPVFYVFSLNGLEIYLQKNTETKINKIIIQNDKELYQGRHSVREEINRNISAYLTAKSIWYSLGISTSIIVKTNNNKILYPAQLSEVHDEFQQGLSDEIPNYMDVAAENYKILNDGLVILTEVRIRQNSWLSSSILIFYIILALLILRAFIKKSLKRNDEIENKQNKKIEELSMKLLSYETELPKIKENEKRYSESITGLNQEKENLSSDIDELLEEMERLEDGLKTQKRVKRKKRE